MAATESPVRPLPEPGRGARHGAVGDLVACCEGDVVGAVGPRIGTATALSRCRSDGSRGFAPRTRRRSSSIASSPPPRGRTRSSAIGPRTSAATSRMGVRRLHLLVRRSAPGSLAGWDSRLLPLREDTDLCRRLREPATASRSSRDGGHARQGASAPRAAALPLLAASRDRYAAKHYLGRALLGAPGRRAQALTHVSCLGAGSRRGSATACARGDALAPREHADLSAMTSAREQRQRAARSGHGSQRACRCDVCGICGVVQLGGSPRPVIERRRSTR